MKRKMVITLAALALATSAGMVAAADGSHGRRGGGDGLHARHGGGMGNMHMRMLHRLDLSDQQKEQIKALREGNKAERLSVRKDINRLQNQLHGEMLEDRPDRRRVVSIAQEIDEARSKMHIMKVETWLDIRELLTDEQRDELLAMPRGGPHGRHGKKGRHGGKRMHRMELHERDRDTSQSQ